MANITMAKSTSNPICSKGAIALMIDLSTTWRPAYEKEKKNEKKKKKKITKRIGRILLMFVFVILMPVQYRDENREQIAILHGIY